MMLDMHCHCREGSPDALVSIEDTIIKLIKKGYDGMLVTDHDSYNGFKSIRKNYGDFVILRGIEYDSLDAGHLIIVLPTDKPYDIFEYRGMAVKDVLKIVHVLGGIVGPAHPYDYSRLGVCNTKNRNNSDIFRQFDFIETFNGCLNKKSNILSEYLAKEYNKPCFGGSDSHTINSVGLGYTKLPINIKTESELIELVKISNYNTFKADGEFLERKHEVLHSLGIITGGYMYGLFNSCLGYKHRNCGSKILDALNLN